MDEKWAFLHTYFIHNNILASIWLESVFMPELRGEQLKSTYSREHTSLLECYVVRSSERQGRSNVTHIGVWNRIMKKAVAVCHGKMEDYNCLLYTSRCV